MQSTGRAVTRSARRLQPRVSLQQRRFDSHHSHHSEPSNESFGRSFFIGLLSIPAALLVYKISRPGENGQEPYFTRLIKETYEDYATKWENRNDLHTRMIEQAAADRTLFLSSDNGRNRHIDLRFPEIVNTGSPWNVPAGHGSANMDALVQKYQKEAHAENERKLQQLRDNKVPVEQPLQSSTPKITPAAIDS